MAAVEYAMVAPLIFLAVLMFFEFDRYVFVRQAMEEAARSGARLAILQGATSEEVQTQIDPIMKLARIADYSLDVTPRLTTDFQQGDIITVTVSAGYDDFSWLGSMPIFQGTMVSTACSLPKEG